MRTRDRWILRVASLLLSVGLALVYLALNDGYGAGDLNTMVTWMLSGALAGMLAAALLDGRARAAARGVSVVRFDSALG